MTGKSSKPPVSESASGASGKGEAPLVALTGLWLGLALVKFGNPVILNAQVDSPVGVWQMVFMSWPVAWGYWGLALITLVSVTVWDWRVSVPLWLAALPLAWLLWQMVSAIQTVEPSLTKPTLAHFTACVVSFYVGMFALSKARRLRGFWLGLLGGFIVVLAVGWQQHFGGLEETRRYFYHLPNWQDYPPEFIKKLGSNRIYSTLFYPNALAGVIILLLPALLVTLGALGSKLARLVVVSVAGVAGLACLYWSGSKAGWLIVLGMGVVAFLHRPWPRNVQLSLAGLILLAGLLGFLGKYADYFVRGAASASARMDYWQAGWQLIKEKPVLGSGPGTFMVGYKRLKAPETEMARLAHNDYLQQGTDSGVVGFAVYVAFITCSMVWSYSKSKSAPLGFAVWLGVTGLAVQSAVEFGLYIPATAWTQFLLLGWLLGYKQNGIDTLPAAP